MHLTRATPPLEQAVKIASAGFERPVSPELIQDVVGHLGLGTCIYSFIETDVVVGFAIFDVIGPEEEILYLSGIILAPVFQQRRNVIEAIRTAQRDLPSTRYLAYRTQSLRMYTAGRAACDAVTPLPDGRRSADGLVVIGQIVADKLGGNFPVTEGCYGGPLYGRQPMHHDLSLSRWWDSLCNFERGDAVIVVGSLPSLR